MQNSLLAETSFLSQSHFYDLTYISIYDLLLSMSDTTKAETVSFTVKGQVVIPRRIRREFEIESGTKAVVQVTPEGILLKPITSAAIKRARGILKRKPGERPFRQWWSEYKKEEKTLEEVRYARLRSR
jgi:AbrB family looped-hinge helix DNA binding protein